MTVRVQELAAALTREAAATIIHVASHTPEERLRWEPLDNGRTILDQMTECCLANAKWTNILRTGIYADIEQSQATRWYEELTTLEQVSAKLRETAAALVEAIEAVPDEKLAEPIATPWGPYPYARAAVHAYWNMAYHEGQINYVQTLYGDFEEHDPE